MLEKLKAEVLLAYKELNRYAGGMVSAIDRDSGLIVVKSARDAVVVDLQGNVVEGKQSLPADIQPHIAIYEAFPKLGGVAQPHTRFAAIFAQEGMGIPAMGAFQGEIPCASSAAEIGNTFWARNMDPLQTPAALVHSRSAYAWGKNAIDAVANAAALEETANLAYRTMQLDPKPQPLQ